MTPWKVKIILSCNIVGLLSLTLIIHGSWSILDLSACKFLLHHNGKDTSETAVQHIFWYFENCIIAGKACRTSMQYDVGRSGLWCACQRHPWISAESCFWVGPDNFYDQVLGVWHNHLSGESLPLTLPWDRSRDFWALMGLSVSNIMYSIFGRPAPTYRTCCAILKT